MHHRDCGAIERVSRGTDAGGDDHSPIEELGPLREDDRLDDLASDRLEPDRAPCGCRLDVLVDWEGAVDKVGR